MNFLPPAKLFRTSHVVLVRAREVHREEEDERNGEKCRAFVAQGEERGKSQDEGQTERGPLKGTNEAMKEGGRRPTRARYLRDV